MKNFAIAALVIASLGSMPGVLVTSANAIGCGADAPAGWLNQGGYCSIIGNGSGGSTLSPTETSDPAAPVPSGCASLVLATGERAHVAAAPAPCEEENNGCGAFVLLDLPIAERIRLAVC
jgi:hypothetical protein